MTTSFSQAVASVRSLARLLRGDASAWLVSRTVGLLSSICALGCDPLPPAELAAQATARVEHGGVGTAFYLGGDLALTNAHVVLHPNCYFETPTRPSCGDHVSAEGGEPLEGGFLCGPVDDRYVSEVPGESCTPVYEAAGAQITLTRFNETADVLGLVYANKDLDLAILRIAASERLLEIRRALGPATLETREPRRGDRVLIAGHPVASEELVAEECEVVSERVEPRRDPDTAQPSDFEVPSFEIACSTPRHGSSGSPVFAAETGALLGLLWTGTDGSQLITSVAAWRAYLDDPARATVDTELEAILARAP